MLRATECQLKKEEGNQLAQALKAEIWGAGLRLPNCTPPFMQLHIGLQLVTCSMKQEQSTFIYSQYFLAIFIHFKTYKQDKNDKKNITFVKHKYQQQ